MFQIQLKLKKKKRKKKLIIVKTLEFIIKELSLILNIMFQDKNFLMEMLCMISREITQNIKLFLMKMHHMLIILDILLTEIEYKMWFMVELMTDKKNLNLENNLLIMKKNKIFKNMKNKKVEEGHGIVPDFKHHIRNE